MVDAQPENKNDQCTVKTIDIAAVIEEWVSDHKKAECLVKVDHDEDFRKKVRNALATLYQAHKIDQLKSGIQGIQYEDPFFQFGYMYKHSMFSARSLSEVMHCSNVSENLAMPNNITVVCLGGGPGTDVLGVLDYFMKYMGDFEGQLDIQLYDRKDKWGPTWESLKTAMEAELHDHRVRVRFHDFDVTMTDKNKPAVQILQNADVITMHYFMEEVYSERERAEVKECFKYIIQTAKPGALFLYSGMYMFDTMDWVHQLLQDNCELLTPGTEPPRKKTYRTPERIPYIKVDLHQEGDLKLFDDIRDDLKTGGYPIVKVSQRFEGEVVYRLYKKK